MIELSSKINTFYIVLFFILIVLFTIYIYKTTIPQVTTTKRVILITLRSIAFFLMLFLIFEPLLTIIKKKEEKPVLAVLLDDSKSMSITDKSGNRVEILKKIIESKEFDELKNIGDVKFFSFGDKTKMFEEFKPDSLKFYADVTNISKAIKEATKLLEGKNLKSLLIISDGEYNTGQNPVYLAESFNGQINTIGIGDSSEQKDISITKIITNNIVYKGTKVPVNVFLKSSGYENESISVSLKYEGKTIETKNLNISSGTTEYNLDFLYEPEEEGIKKYNIIASPLKGEITTKNNQKSFFVKVLKNKLKITIIAGAPSHDVSFVKNGLLQDGNIDVKTYTQRVDGDFYEGLLDSKQLEETECIYLIGFPQSNTKQSILEMVKDAISNKGKPVFFISDFSIDYGKLKILEPYLPFTVKQINNNEILVSPNISVVQLKSPVLKITGTEEDLNIWNNLPPIFRTETVFEKKPESEVLSYLKINNIPFNYTLVLQRKVYKQKSVAITGYGIWRWKLLSEGLGGNSDFLKIFLGNSVRWLTTREDDRKFKVITSKEVFSSGESVEFFGELYDDNYQPIDNALVKVKVQSDSDTYEVTMNSIGSGRYTANIEGLKEGDYKFTGLAENGEIKLGEDNGRFSVGESNLEFINLRMNAPLLKLLAQKTGGGFFTADNFYGIVEKLKKDKNFSSIQVSHKDEFQLWNVYYILIVIILLLSIEWYIRKKSGLL